MNRLQLYLARRDVIPPKPPGMALAAALSNPHQRKMRGAFQVKLRPDERLQLRHAPSSQ
jgi:hypothetical protein